MGRSKKNAVVPMGSPKKRSPAAAPPPVHGNLSRHQKKRLAAELRTKQNPVLKHKNSKAKQQKYQQQNRTDAAAVEWLVTSPKQKKTLGSAKKSEKNAAKKANTSKKATEKKKAPILSPVSKYKTSKKAEKSKKAKKKAAADTSKAAQNNSINAKPKQQTQLPAKRSGHGRIPWMTNIDSTPSSPVTIDLTTPLTIDLTADGERSNVKKFRLPTDDCDPVLLQRFSDELRAFGEYIRLTPSECEARNALLEQMHNVAVRVFQNSPEINVGDLELQVFGSYACRDVCTFRSDVDVALWGVVFPKLTHKKRNIKVSRDPKEESSTKVVPTTEKVQKWRLALAMADESNAMTPDDNGKNGAVRKTAGEPSDQPSGEGASGDEKDNKQEDVEEAKMPLFVLDRTGMDLPEDPTLLQDDAVKPQAPASVTTQATVAESESSVEEEAEKTKRGHGDSSDDDTADKLTESRTTSVSQSSSSQKGFADDTLCASAASNQSNRSDSENNDEDVAVNFFHKVAVNNNTEASDFSRRKVVDGLQRFFRGLRNSGLTRSIQLISRARVPIIKMEALPGVEVDCSIGGMNGADTSLYSLKMTEKYQSFAPVVLALKTIMGQQNLDTPFNGGLGSYKLYVLVASHIAKHVELGGRDDPGEIFLSFVFRYGDSVSHLHAHRETRTRIAKDDVISCGNGGNADLSNVFLIKECRGLFGSLWKRLWGLLRKTGKAVSNDTPQVSFLTEVIHTTWLDHSRQTNISKANMFLKEREKQDAKKSNRNPIAKRKVGPSIASAGRQNRDLTEEELVESYYCRSLKKARTNS